MSAELFIANTLRIAKADLDGARLLASEDNRNGIYLLEQAAEKIIKAVLTSEGKHGGIGHQLAEMVDLLPDQNPLKPRLREIQRLGDYATTYRYASPAGRIAEAPRGKEFEALAQKVQVALDEAVSRFGVDLAKKDQRAQNPGPIR